MLTYRGDKFIKGKKFTINESVYRFQKRDNNDRLVFESADGKCIKLTEDEFNDKSKTKDDDRENAEKVGKDTFRSVGDLDSHIDSVAKEFRINFDSDTPFEYFYAPDSDGEDEVWYSSEYDWADFYDRILHDLGYGENPILNDCRAEVHEISDGNYEMQLTIDNQLYAVDLCAWDTKEDVKKTVNYILGLLNKDLVD